MTILRFTVTEQDTATALGSGDVPALATPRLLAWMEAATVAAAAARVDSSSTTVGTDVWISHRRAVGPGTVVEVRISEVRDADRGLVFEVEARRVEARQVAASATGAVPGLQDDREPPRDPDLVAHGRIIRAVVDRGRFLARLR